MVTTRSIFSTHHHYTHVADGKLYPGPKFIISSKHQPLTNTWYQHSTQGHTIRYHPILPHHVFTNTPKNSSVAHVQQLS